MRKEYKALVLEESDGQVVADIKSLRTADLPDHDVIVDVEWSNLNYKDGMVLKGLGGLVKNYPHIPGIDLAGTVSESKNDRYQQGDKVVLTGWRVGEMYWGGYTETASVKSEWLVPLPTGLDTRLAMAIGTAGLTSMLCIRTLQDQGVSPDDGPVLVTGASGGVGSVAVAFLAALGFEVVAASGSNESHRYLASLGASQVIDRTEFEGQGRPLEKERWAGVVDTVGGNILARAVSQIRYGGTVAACGLAASPKLNMTVIPFLLRGAKLIGIDSVMQPYAARVEAWNKIAELLPSINALESIIEERTLEDLPELADSILSGKVQGRTAIRIS